MVELWYFHKEPTDLTKSILLVEDGEEIVVSLTVEVEKEMKTKQKLEDEQKMKTD